MKLLDFIICDDIRQEANNKLSLMGIYNEKIVFQHSKKTPPKWPLHLKLGCYLRVQFDANEPRPNKGFINYKLNGAELISAPIEIELEQNPIWVFFLIAENFAIAEPGKLEISSEFQKSGELLGKYDVSVQILTKEHD